MNARSLPALLALLLVACGDGRRETGPGGVSVEDAKALDKAAAKLDAEAAGEIANQPDKPD